MKLLNLTMLLTLLFVTACNKSSSGSSASSNQNSPSEASNPNPVCTEGERVTKKFYQSETVKFNETCVSQEATRQCQNGKWIDSSVTSYTSTTCEVLKASEEEITRDLAFYLITCGEISNISECVHAQKLIHEELL